MKKLLNWKVGFCDSNNTLPKEFYEATVPGAVQLDYAKHYGLADYRKGLNFQDYKWMEDKYWVYLSEFDATNLSDSKDLFLIAKGIDYQYEIWANDKKICEYEGMYKQQKICLSKFKGEIINLKIVIYPVPKSSLPEVHTDTRDEANQSCKPAVSYGWDFHPRLIPLGIWDEIYIEVTKNSVVSEPEVSYKLSNDLKSADVTFAIEGLEGISFEMYDPSGSLVYSGSGAEQKFAVSDIQLWWCNNYGEPKLYSYKVLQDENVIFESKIGFKKIELVKAEGSWGEGLNYPMSRNTPPITVKLNNTVIFAKGTNWVAPEIFYGTLNYERYREQLEMVKKANLNFVRIWGGAIINKESFFEICDELGILVWQEFPLACNNYQTTDRYISVLKSEVSAIIDRLKKHVCLMLWCGGNELFNNWSCMTDQDAAIRLMNALTFENTPEIPYLPTAPVMGMAHGPYKFNMEDGSEIIERMSKSHNTAYTEFGGPGHSTQETLEMIGTKEQLWPFEQHNEIVSAHCENWNNISIERYFGEVQTLDEMIECGQFLQSVGQSFVFEEARRQKPYCSIVSNWCFNEPWPNTCNNSLLSYPSNVKPAYYSVANSCRSVLASARYRKLTYMANEILDFDVYLLNDSLKKIEDGTVSVYVQVGDGEKVFLLNWDYKDVAICTNAIGPTVRYQLPYVEDADTVKIILECGEYSSKYNLLYRLPKRPPNAPKKMNAILDENQF